MISKRIDRGKKTSSFDRLGRYVLDAKTEEAEILWTRTAEYILDLKDVEQSVPGEEKVLWARISNCEAEIPALAIAEILSTQAENSRSRLDKTYHCVISFPDGEQPTRAQLEDIEDAMCQALGFGEHQRISAVHQDTDNIHLHLAINKIHPVTFNALEPFRDYYTRNRICRELELKHGLTLDNGIGQGKRLGKAQEMEAHTGEQSLWSWIQANAASNLKIAAQEGENWQTLHQAFSDVGLAIKPRGAGLVISTMDGQSAVKASSIDRTLSFKALAQRFGEYQAPSLSLMPKAENRVKPYQPGPKLKDEQTRALYAEYQLTREQLRNERFAMKSEQRAKREAFACDLKIWHHGERERIRHSAMNTKQKREAYSQLAGEKQKALANHRQTEKAQSQVSRTAQKPLNWESFLIESAENGNGKALEILRQRRQRQERAATALLRADNYDAAKHVVYNDLKPIARKSGEMLYQVRDGGAITDERQRVRIDVLTSGSAFLALSMASERFQNQPLDVQGNDDFKKQVLQFAVQYHMPVQFKDSALEKQRQQAIAVSKQKKPSQSPALYAFIQQRNLMREKVSDVLAHRLWQASDTGEVIYEGRRNLTDGSQAILLRRGDEMLVKPVKDTEARNLKVGQVLLLEAKQQSVKVQKGMSL